MFEKLVCVVAWTGWDVSEDSNGRHENGHAGIFNIFDDARDYSWLDYHSYFIFIGVGVVTDGPATVSNDLSIDQSSTGDRMAEHRYGKFDTIVFGKRTTSAQVAQSPAAMFNKRILGSFIDDFHQIYKSSRSDDIIPVEDAVATDVTDRPDSLLDYTRIVGF